MNLIISLNYSTLIKVSKYLELVQLSFDTFIKHSLIGKNWPLHCIEFKFRTEVRWDNRHQSHTSLLWKLGCHGNQGKTSITSLS